MPDNVILAEDDRELREFLREVLEEAGYAVHAFASADEAFAWLDGDGDADAVVTDLVMPGMRGHELLAETRRRRPELNVVIITAFGAIDSAIALVKAGAYDYLTKPFGTDELLLTLDRALEESRLRRQVARLTAGQGASLPGFVGASRAIQDVAELAHRGARSAFPVLITGESGTGKELVARGLHQLSGRGGRFVAVNCAALPENLLESELFGHDKGAFTGAGRDKPGLLETADGGTLFLDEITELPAALQPKLLRALEEGEVRRLGATRPRRFDVRFVAATNRDRETEVAEGRFREDLYWRLHVLHIHIPPLRERPADIPLLAENFLHGHTLSQEAMAVLTAYPWPGNVRELRNALDRAVALAPGDEIRLDDLPPRIRETGGAAVRIVDASRQALSLRDLERAYIFEVLRQTGGNKSRAAEILGLDRRTLYRKLDEYRATDDATT
ncbi:MAG TPA: sigma-54 dependent transcriptional regulator [Longimicrobiales bacterium]|nr:sigma-54 dependent transcriptional regulator [Longimicrobiales bacterium]